MCIAHGTARQIRPPGNSNIQCPTFLIFDTCYNAVNALYLSVRTQAATKKYISAALDRLNHFDLRRVKPQSLAPPSASVQARNVTRLRFEFQGARARRHRRRRWRAPAGSRPGARRSLASSMVKGRELRGLYGTKRLVNFLSSRMSLSSSSI